jgi:phosphatidylglycerophosphate synthase
VRADTPGCPVVPVPRVQRPPWLVQNVQVTRLRGRDVATVPNLVSVAGLLLTVHGARRLHTPAGIAEVAVCRLLDLVDGYLARALDQSSQFGAGLDAVLDKAGVTAVGLELWRGCAPSRPALLAIAGQNAVNLVSTVITGVYDHGSQLQPTAEGKLAMAAQNAAMAAYAMSGLFAGSSRRRRALLWAAHGATVIGIGYGLPASGQYVRRARHTVSAGPMGTVNLGFARASVSLGEQHAAAATGPGSG